MTDLETRDASGTQCDHCDSPAIGGAAGGGQPPEHWCDDHRPADLYEIADDFWMDDTDVAAAAARSNAELVARLRAMADAVERLDAAEPLPRVDCTATLYLFEGDEADRIRAVVRLNTELGHTEHETAGHPHHDGRCSFRPKDVHEGYAFTLIEVAEQVTA